MMLVVQSQDSVLYSEELLAEAKEYNGRRIELRKLVDAKIKPSELLDAHTQLMLSTNHVMHVMHGMLYKVSLNGKEIHLLGCSHKRIIHEEPQNEESAEKLIFEIIHPLVVEILSKSNLYVELVKNPENVEQITRFVVEKKLLPLPHCPLVRSQLIEDTAKKVLNYGLDIALSIKQNKEQRPYFSLETVDEQMVTMEAVSDAQRKDPARECYSSEALLEAIDAVQWGNLDSLTELNKEFPASVLENYEEREVKMEGRIFDKLSSGENSLFAIGGSHLPRIISLLKARGAFVEQIILS